MHAAPQAYTCMRTRATRTTRTHVRTCARARVCGNSANSLLAATCSPGANVAESTKKLQKSLEVSEESCTFASGTKF